MLVDEAVVDLSQHIHDGVADANYVQGGLCLVVGHGRALLERWSRGLDGPQSPILPARSLISLDRYRAPGDPLS